MAKDLDLIFFDEYNPMADIGDDDWIILRSAECYKEDGLIGVIIDNKKAIPPMYDSIRLITAGRASKTIYAVVKYKGKYGLLSEENRVIEECIYDNICFIHKPKKNNYLVSSLKFVIGSEYLYYDLYSGVRFKSNVNYDHIDLFYDIVSKSELSTMEWRCPSLVPICNKKQAVAIGNSSGIVLSDGTILFASNLFKDVGTMRLHITEQDDYSLHYELRSYIVFWNDFRAWVDHNGKIFGVFDPVYKSMRDLNNGEYAAQNDTNKWGIIDKNENVLVEFVFDDFDKLMDRNKPAVSKSDDQFMNCKKQREGIVSTHERQTYEQYGGSYAQDEMGYSDDDIDTIFDGDPSAYWNID